MTNTRALHLFALGLGLVVGTAASAQTTAFSYQGTLSDGVAPATGSYDLTFSVWTSTNGPAQVGATITNAATVVSNGIFAATLDFGAGVFTGADRWLEIGVRTNGGGTFTLLSPRVAVLPVPYALWATSAGSVAASDLVGTIADGQLSANVALVSRSPTFSVTVTATNLSTPSLVSRSAGEALMVKAADGTGSGGALTVSAGNAGVPSGGAGGNLTLQAGNAMAAGGTGYSGLGLAGAVNITAGSGYNNVGGNVTLRSGGNSPWTQALNSFSKISLQGVGFNTGDGAVIDVEGGHNIQYGSPPQYSSGGNVLVTAGNATGNFTGGNIILFPGTGNPNGNVGIGTNSPGSLLHVAGTVTATNLATPFIASRSTGESLALKAQNGSGNGGNLTLNAGSAGASGGGAGGNLTLKAGGNMPVGGSGWSGLGASGGITITGGDGYNSIGGNVLLQSGSGSPWALSVGGFSKVALQGVGINSGDSAVLDVEGGHVVSSGGSAISSGGNVKITAGNGVGAYAGGNIILSPGTGTPNGNVGIGTTTPSTTLQVAGTVTATGFSGSASGLTGLPLTGLQSGGAANAQVLTWNGSTWAASNAPTGGGGLATLGGSGTNETFYGTTVFNGPVTATNINAAANKDFTLLGSSGSSVGGNITIASGNAGVPTGGSGGNLNLAAGHAMSAGGSGWNNIGPAGAVNITAGSGYNSNGGNVTLTSGGNSPWNLTLNSYSKISLVGSAYSAGAGAQVDVEGEHNTVSNGSNVGSGGNVRITAGSASGSYAGGNILLMPGTGTPAGNVGIGTTTPVSALQVIGTVTATAFNPPSDRNLKEHFREVSARDVLEKVTGLNITRWNFKGDEATPHLGPMAQDFHAAFGLGTDDKHIATVDADGVALAAIQGLNQKLEVGMRDAEARSRKLELENAELKQRLEKLERLVNRERGGVE